jgi:HEAT repeat protein
MTLRSLRFLVLICVVGASASAGMQENPSTAPAHLLAELRGKDKGDRRNAANQLGAMRARGALRPLVEALSDKEPKVREAAAFALGQICDPAATGLMIPLLADGDTEVRAAAVRRREAHRGWRISSQSLQRSRFRVSILQTRQVY